ncbi:MAG: ribonuclease HII [Dissulfurimicrobium sp.]|uniref:ribonuclease HII n=1 Tax=Dissulfurimicrobium TaxID=1769732 RepID=UPI001EDC4CF0|nr:ribonuclease HII [Dissulfurimicrobium hydrothermale]UKL13420.1 ribonuclease HII [Dissulfurimicrobium hydrothermale]
MQTIGLGPVAGVDEVGRGCLAGPVVAAAVVFPRGSFIPEVRDSKVLTSNGRIAVEGFIRKAASAIATGVVWPDEIDRINVLRASLKAMAIAVDRLRIRPGVLLIDGNQPIPYPLPQKTIVKGDSRSFTIAAASIIAKVLRDTIMERLSSKYPQYDFARHKGYPTRGHICALKLYGPCPMHRRTFKGVREFFTETDHDLS